MVRENEPLQNRSVRELEDVEDPTQALLLRLEYPRI